MAKGKYHEWLTEEGLLKLESWARDGLTDEQIAENMGVRRETLYDWKKKHPIISNTLKKGKDIIDTLVENALLKRALGYTYAEVTSVRVKDPETGEIKMVDVKKVTKEVTPDTTAQIFWLKNRRPDKWRDVKKLDVDGQLKTSNPFSDLTTEELRRLIKDG